MPERLDALTGLRIFAALWVCGDHFRQITPTTVWEYPLVDPLFQNGGFGVELFFVLSGFILAHVYFDRFRQGVSRPQYWSFVTYRIARIYPVHVVTLLIMIALFVAAFVITGEVSGEAERYSPVAILSALTLTQAWFNIDTPNMPSWSISAEWFAYLLFPLLCIALARVRGSLYWFLGLGFALSFLSTVVYPDYLLRIAACFPIGMAAYLIAQRIRPTLERMPYLGLITTVLIITWAMLPGDPRPEVGTVLFAVLIMALSTQADWTSRALSTRFLVYLGQVSFAIYMFHWIARVIVRVPLEQAGILEQLPPRVIVASYLVVTMIGAILLFHFVEEPGRRAIRALSKRAARNKPAAGTVTAP